MFLYHYFLYGSQAIGQRLQRCVILITEGHWQAVDTMKAPNHFQAVNLLTQQPNVPPPARSRYRKFDIYRDVGQFRFIDEHAISVSILHTSIANQLLGDICQQFSQMLKIRIRSIILLDDLWFKKYCCRTTMLQKEMHFSWNYACEMAVHVAKYIILITRTTCAACPY